MPIYLLSAILISDISFQLKIVSRYQTVMTGNLLTYGISNLRLWLVWDEALFDYRHITSNPLYHRHVTDFPNEIASGIAALT